MILLAGAAAAWPLAARAQQPTPPTIGFLSSSSPELYAIRMSAFAHGLKKEGFVEGENVMIDHRWAGGKNELLPELAADLVRRQVAVLVAAGGTPSAIAAKAATITTPIVFGVAVDPVNAGLVASLNRPGGNLTGVTNLNVEAGQKQLDLMRESLPGVPLVGVLVNPTSPGLVEPFVGELRAAASAFGIELRVLTASGEDEFDDIFSTLVQARAGGLLIMPDVYFNAHSRLLAALSVRHRLPTIFRYREFTAAGGLMSYGSSEQEYYELIGSYAGKILKGAKPGDLPVQQATRLDLIINLKTARALGITVPLSLLVRADEVME